MSDFAADIRHWPTLADFEAHLRAHPAAIAAWATEIVYHHTYRPLRHQWHGRKTMEGLVAYYRDTQGWPSGPHLFIAPDGIWQLTPLNLPGTHAMAGNGDSWGIEVVGDYDQEEWPKPIAELALGVGAALLRWRGLPANRETVSPHSAYNPAKTCPGKEIDLDWVRRELKRRLAPSPSVTPATGYSEHSLTIGQPQATLAHAIRYCLSRPHGHYSTWDVAQVILPAYWERCATVEIDPVLAIAQMVHETGNLSSFWSQRPRRNPAGIGVNGEPGAGLSFKDWTTEAIPAHIGRLLAYALPASTGSLTQRLLINEALSFRTLPDYVRGSAPNLRQLGTVHNPANVGRPELQWVGWAKPGKFYGQRIAEIANAIRSIKL